MAYKPLFEATLPAGLSPYHSHFPRAGCGSEGGRLTGSRELVVESQANIEAF